MRFFNEELNETVLCEVISVAAYESFESMITASGISRTLPGVASLEEGLRVYSTYYSRDVELAHGVLGIEIKRIESS